MDTLANLAAKNADINDRSDIARLLSETSLALLRRQSNWNSAAYESEYFGSMQSKGAEPRFQRLAVKERAKFEEEKSFPVATIRSSNAMSSSVPTQAVVSLIIAMRGRSTAHSKSARTLSEVKSCLQSLAADALTDEGDNVMAVEVLWTPVDKGEVLSSVEVVEDYPELIQL